MTIMKKRTIGAIIRSLKDTLSELEATIDNTPSVPHHPARDAKKDYTGPTGGIKMLKDQGFFKSPKSLAETLAELHKEGYVYQKQVVSTSLIRSVRSYFLTRINATDTGSREKWKYVERK